MGTTLQVKMNPRANDLSKSSTEIARGLNVVRSAPAVETDHHSFEVVKSKRLSFQLGDKEKPQPGYIAAGMHYGQ